ncbi:diaminopimelate decarboxylase [Endozoicomonas sp. SM1973]|uniref:Diaminopimelate decarboxylase n=1 Tax=Spartinivicinus marinus TaxID=2994442 RepID=A0A853IA43_9GAMM|nr:diaminopimelate decarboxylase [Spartinivicinus marinus]MCX4027408.1 diaminopimelate decarboxylase [Spartinivicinus marinus]NYZ66417.1 diaminopimelate decarboxylase [Spartinivicinus marinus]
MDHFLYRDGELFAEDVPVTELAKQYGTPCYVYSRATLERHYTAYTKAMGKHPHLICYAVKANSNLAVLNVLAKLGAGFDIVSVGELERVLAAGGDPAKVVFSGVAKQEAEIARALEVGIHCFNVESEFELARIQKVAAEMGQQAAISLRINPDVDAKTHPYISTGLKENKFGISFDDAISAYQKAAQLPNLQIIGVDCHIGSQLTEIDPFLDAMDRLLFLVDELAKLGIELKHLDLGGGLGVRYQQEIPPEPDTYAKAVMEKIQGRNLTLVFEPGRSIAANAGILVTQVDLLKDNGHKHFAIVDAAMNDLIRPSLYNAWQDIVQVKPRIDGLQANFDIVGPVCETGDFLGKNRELNLKPGDLLAIRSAGAYGFVMSSNYNSRNRAAEVMVDKDQHHLIRARETVSQQIANEYLLPN